MEVHGKTGADFQPSASALKSLAGALFGLWLAGSSLESATQTHADPAIGTPGTIQSPPEARESGLLVRFKELASQRTDARAARLLALHVPSGEPPTPFLDPGPFEAAWEGWLEIPEEDAYTFRFSGNGRIELTIGGTAVLETLGDAIAEPLRLKEGIHPLRVQYRSPDAEPARMRLLWSSSQFGPEPIPPEALSHDRSDAALQRGNLLRRGRELLAEQRCLKCHQPDDASFFNRPVAMPELGFEAPSLMGVGERLRADWIQRWLEDPQAVRSSATMPHIVNNREEAADIAAYLATLGQPPPAGKAAQRAQITAGGNSYATQGCAGCHTLNPATEAGERLSLVDLASKWHRPALETFLRNPAQHHPSTTMPHFRLNDAEAAALAAFLFDRSAAPATTPVEGNVSRGLELVQQRGCVNCHNLPVKNRFNALSFKALSDWQRGCLSEQPAQRGKAPRLALDSSAREALRALAGEGFASLQRRSSIEFAARQIRSWDCRACHKLDGHNDRWSDHAEEVEPLLSNPDENPFAQRRPALTWAGEKLQPDWLENVLAGKIERSPRPWLKARMPAVRGDPSLLAKGMIATHGLDTEDFQLGAADSRLVSRGRSLATGIGGGFWCHSCHGASGAGVPAIDLTLIGERLRPEFYHWQMRTPSRADPDSPMPAFADAEGRTRLRDILAGDAQRQFEAIWHFLLDSRADRVAARGEQAKPVEWRPSWADHYKKMDKGPFYSGAIEVPGGGRRDKGLSIRVGERRQATVHFDTDLLRMSAGWTGDFLTFRSHEDYGIRNSPPPLAAGDVRFTSPAVTGWKSDSEPRFADTRGRTFGPIPEEQGRYQGLYLHGKRVVLSYRVHGIGISESPWHIENEQTGAFVRDLRLERHEQPLAVLLFDAGSNVELERRGALQIARAERDERMIVAAIRTSGGIELVSTKGQVAVRFNPKPSPRSVRALIWEGKREQLDDFLELAAAAGNPDDLEQLAKPGPALWGEPLITQGELGKTERAYAVDLITAPQENPFHAMLHFTGLDFLPDGRALLSTMHGDVWLVGGIDESLGKLTWKRFATGLNMPFGVRVVQGRIYVSCEDELTILHDRNGDGEADFYENFRNLIAPGAGSWRQAFGLEIDAEGNFYFVRGQGHPQSGLQNGVIRISADGRKMELIASGFRQPFGMGISPEGRITVSQQEGTWVPQTPVHKIDLQTRQGSFYGFDPKRNRKENPYARELGYEPPLVWLPRDVDNSGAGQAWVNSDVWGLPRGQMLHFSYGRGTVMQLMHEEVNGDRQGAVAHLAKFRRVHPRTGTFHPRDGQLYAAGHSPAGGFERVRYTGRSAHLPVAFHAHENGLRIRFNHPLNPSEAVRTSNYTVHRWNYRWSAGYGSEFYSLKRPGSLGEDPVDVLSAELLGAADEIFLHLADMTPVMQMRVAYQLEAADGTKLNEEIHNTIHALGPAFVR
jgi:mono/diheme cytochrome c family protein